MEDGRNSPGTYGETCPIAGAPEQSPEQPDVSFIVATHNVAPYIEEAVQSGLGQRDAAVEVIVVDNGSTDATVEIVSRMAAHDTRIVLVRLAVNGGPSRARNVAIAHARGRWLAILDGDDVILPERSRYLLDLAAQTDADVVADNFERMDVQGRPTGATMLAASTHDYAFRVDTAAFLRGNSMYDRRAHLGAIKPMFRADFLAARGLRLDDELHFAEDFLFCLDCLMTGARFFVGSAATYRYRMRPGSVSWRIGCAELDPIRQAFARVLPRLTEPAAAAAGRDYALALETARDFALVVDEAKRGHWPSAIRAALGRPRAWPLVRRYGTAALANRLSRRRPARAPLAGSPSELGT